MNPQTDNVRIPYCDSCSQSRRSGPVKEIDMTWIAQLRGTGK